MYRFENITSVINDRKAGHLAGPVHYAVHTNYGILAAGYNPLMWLMALLLAAVVAGCGGGNGSIAAPAAPAAPATPGGTTLAAVNLLTAGNFAILASSAITCNTSCTAASTVPPAVTGDVGVSVGTSISGFPGYAVAATNDYATASNVVAAPTIANSGRLYTPSFTGGQAGSTGLTPAKMTAAQNDMVTAYNDAKNRAAGTGTFLNAGTAGDISGLTLAPGVYTWTTNPNVAINSNVTLSGTATDVWIFQIPGTLTQASAASVLLGGNAMAKNIFWQVTGAVTLGASPAHIEGVILSAGGITLGTGATANGRLLDQTQVTLGGAVTQPAP